MIGNCTKSAVKLRGELINSNKNTIITTQRTEENQAVNKRNLKCGDCTVGSELANYLQLRDFERNRRRRGIGTFAINTGWHWWDSKKESSNWKTEEGTGWLGIEPKHKQPKSWFCQHQLLSAEEPESALCKEKLPFPFSFSHESLYMKTFYT